MDGDGTGQVDYRANEWLSGDVDGSCFIAGMVSFQGGEGLREEASDTEFYFISRSVYAIYFNIKKIRKCFTQSNLN